MSGHSNGPPVKRWKQAPLNFESSRRSFLKVQGYYRQTIITLCNVLRNANYALVSLAILSHTWSRFTVPSWHQLTYAVFLVHPTGQQTNEIITLINNDVVLNVQK